MKSQVYFGESKLRQAYDRLKESKVADRMLHKWIARAIDDLSENAFCGIQIPKRLIPQAYLRKHEIDNLWKYDMPKGWRLIYTVANGDVCIISILLEWMSHKEYERRFRY